MVERDITIWFLERDIKTWFLVVFFVLLGSYLLYTLVPEQQPVDEVGLATDRFEGKTQQEKVDIKSNDMVLIGSVAREKVTNYDIEIIEINKIDGGVEVLAKAWNGKNQIAFGDGTVEIERFLIYNPPILVADPLGDIVQIGKAGGDDDGTREFRYREDPKAALLQTLEHIISVKQQKYDSQKIVPGKIGNTTSTFYPDASPETSTVDGRAEHAIGCPCTWAALIAAAGDATNDDAAQENLVIWGDNGTAYTKLTRGVFLFDTSTISSDTVSSATFSVQVYAKAIDGTPTPTYNVYASNPASDTAVVAGDYDSFGSTAFSDTAVAYADVSTVAKTNWTLNVSGLSAIDTGGITKLGVREATYDVGASAPTLNTGQTYINSYFADQTGTTNDPVLVVEHAAGGALEATTTPHAVFHGSTAVTGATVIQ